MRVAAHAVLTGRTGSVFFDVEVPNPGSQPGISELVLGTASDAAIAMEVGADAVLMNSGIAMAQEPELMAAAMKHAVEAGRLAYLAGRMQRKLYASASSPLEGVVR